MSAERTDGFAAVWKDRLENLKAEIGRAVVGQRDAIDRVLAAILSNGHVLIEGVPGLAKTTLVLAISMALGLKFKRIQFTPDLLPSDLIGTLIYDQKSGVFATHFGPVFTNLLLADEINRAPAKVQSALLEAMQERGVTIGDRTMELPRPFVVLATQNPIEQEGTYPLPEAQLDRFMMKIRIGYPAIDDERKILKLMGRTAPEMRVANVMSADDLFAARNAVDGVYQDEKVGEYALHLVAATREPGRYGMPELEKLVEYGASPRATIALTVVSKAWALLAGRGFVTPDDVKAIGADVLRHRIILTYEADARKITADDVIEQVFDNVPVP